MVAEATGPSENWFFSRMVTASGLPVISPTQINKLVDNRIIKMRIIVEAFSFGVEHLIVLAQFEVKKCFGIIQSAVRINCSLGNIQCCKMRFYFL